MTPLKVLHIIGGGEFGGAERHILNLFRAFDKQAVDASVCCLFRAPFAEMAREAGFSVHVVPMRHKLDFRVMSKLTSLIRRSEAEIVHTHGVRANLMGRLAARQAGHKKVLTTVHSLLEMDHPGFISSLANSLVERASRGLTDKFIAVSQGLKDKLVSGGLPEDRVTVIYNGIEPGEFRRPDDPDAALRKLGITLGVPVVGVVARLHLVKGHRFFLEAAADVLTQRPDTRFLVIGDGPCLPALKGQARRLGIEEKVIFTGFVDDVRPVMAGLDLLVISSLWEGFGLSAVEAMALEVPVVATEVGGLPEVVKHGETGLLAPPANASALAKGIIWMLEHPEATSEMVKKGKANVLEKFSAQAMARRTVELYRKIAGWERC